MKQTLEPYYVSAEEAADLTPDEREAYAAKGFELRVVEELAEAMRLNLGADDPEQDEDDFDAVLQAYVDQPTPKETFEASYARATRRLLPEEGSETALSVETLAIEIAALETRLETELRARDVQVAGLAARLERFEQTVGATGLAVGTVETSMTPMQSYRGVQFVQPGPVVAPSLAPLIREAAKMPDNIRASQQKKSDPGEAEGEG